MKQKLLSKHYSDIELGKIIKKTKDGNLAIKLNAIYVIQTQKLSCNKAASKLVHSRETLRRWVNLYNLYGIEGLIDKRKNNKRQNKLYTKDFLDKVKEVFSKECPFGGIWTGKKLLKWIEDNYNVRLSLSAVYSLIHKLGFSWKSPRPKHKCSNREEQEKFKKNFFLKQRSYLKN